MKTTFLRFPEIDSEQKYWFAFLVLATMISSFAFACAAPFSAMAAMAALMLPRSANVCFMLVAWAANQAVGFLFLNYPHDPKTLTWGAVLGVCSVVGGLTAAFAVDKYRKHTSELGLMALALVAGFVGFQFILLLANLTPLGSLSSFAFAIKAKMFFINLVAFAVMLGLTTTAANLRFFSVKRQWA
jgi:hypothetical protein